MTRFERFAEALALTESGNSPEPWGDDGRAAGRWQMHPEFFCDYHPLPAKAGETWDDWFRRTLEFFYLHNGGYDARAIDLAMHFHLGKTAFKRGDDDPAYAVRFTRHWYRIGADASKIEVS